LQLVQPLFLLLIFHLKLLKLTLLLVDFVAEDGVHLLTGQELVHHFADICVSRGLLYFLESCLNSGILLHFFVHFPFQELTPQLLHHKRVSLFDFVGVLAVVLSSLGDGLLPLETLLALLESLVLVLNTGFE
jgi:hypothetical protein